MDVLPGMIAPGAHPVSGSASDPPCWTRGAEAWGRGPGTGPLRLDSSGTKAFLWHEASYKRWRRLGLAPQGEKRLGAPERGASASGWVVTQRLRHLRTCRSLVPTCAAICWLLISACS